jgi:glycosyltransferase involved in cell wall biosynthesis
VAERPWRLAGITCTIDVFIDLSASHIAVRDLQRMIAKWARPENLGAIARRVTGVVVPGQALDDTIPGPSGWAFAESRSPVPELGAALAAAGRDGIPLLLIRGPVEVGNEAVGVLRQCLERDPMFGFAVPRIGCLDGCCFVRLSRHGVGATDWLPRKILADLPDVEILVEVAAPCMLIGPRVLGNFGPLERQFESIGAAMLHCMASARRCGFRTVLSNRAVVGIEGLTCATAAVQPLPGLPDRDQTLLRQLVPDLERSWQEFRAGSWERFERLCTSSIDTPHASRPSLVLDARNLSSTHNGTAQAILGTLKAFKEIRPKWDVAILANPEGAGFHDLERVFVDWPVFTALPEASFTAAVRLSQPWHIQEMVDLHNISLVNAYLMLDTINWDIGYSAPLQLEGTWQFLADHADALLFDSHFTRQRFAERFPTACPVPSLVTHFSFDPSEYARADATSAAGNEEFILVIGNNLDHKDVRGTVETLASAFPFRHIKALGPANVVSPFVSAQRSGGLPELEVHRLYASARFVVFPSFYEGFGFPILTALAYGRTVLARRSALVEELAGECDPRGRLVVFDRREELVELLGRLLHGEPVAEHPLGLHRTNGRPRCWQDVARDILGFLESLLHEPFRNRWIVREHTVRQLLSYRT